ncbi:hypothetical protein V565_186640 [Rhizoctonia solani 123E]|uniref:Uncharacterized protein n=1 Tax=Rhizoctonia solani 123E TaxID=1423351 RepID=A0A074S9H0_9AGAM|nr:hypothetical protein V565_186640 [Rhizoctonia solani 123E]
MSKSSPPRGASEDMTPPATSQLNSAKTPYDPPLNALVRTLPTTIRYSGKVWWNEWIGEPWLSKKGSPNSGARGWMRRKFITQWWLDNMSETDISDKDKLWYFDRTKVGQQLYTYVNNSSVRGTGGRDPNGPGALKDGPVRKHRSSGHDFWRRANRDPYDKAVEVWRKQHNGKDPNFGELRKISFDAFAALPQVEREPWDAKAQEALEENHAQADAPLPSSAGRARCYDVINKELDDILKRGETKARIRLIGAIVHERLDGTLKIERKFSESLRPFSNNPAVSNLLQIFGEWIEETGGELVEGCEPTATVYPNYAKENYPALPNYVGWTLEPLQGLVRGSIKGIFAFQGGIGRVMWTEIKANPRKFFQEKRILTILLENMDDPSRFSMHTTTIWVDFLLACFKKQIPDDHQFQFTLVSGGTKPIHPKDSQEDSRDLVTRDGKRVWMLKFTKTVDRCHHPGGPAAVLAVYPKGAAVYADFMAAGKVHPDAICQPPASRCGLPASSSSTSDVAFCPAEMEYWLNLSKFLTDSSKSRTTLLLDRTNAHQSHLPAVDPKGIYRSKKTLPLLIGSSPQISAAPSTMHFPLAMCQRNPPPNATIGCYEAFFEDVLDEEQGLLVHAQSGTLLGGETGVVGLSRSLLRLQFGFSVARREFDPPEAFPTGYDVSRIPINDYDRLCGWIDTLNHKLEASTQILTQTSTERKGSLDHLQPIPRDDTPATEYLLPASNNSGPVRSGSSALPPSPNPKPQKKRLKVKTGKKPAPIVLDDEESEASPESEDTDEVQDYEELDKTPQDDEGDSWLDEPSFGTTTPLGTEPSDRVRDSEEAPDRLELCSRYGFTGVGSTPEPHSHWQGAASSVWEHKDDIFGKFKDPPPYEPLHFHTPNALIRHIDDITRSCKDAMADLHRYLDINPRISPLIQNDAHLLAQAYPEHQVLYEYICLRRGVWHNAGRVAANGIFTREQRFGLIFREATQAQQMAHKTIQHGIFPDPNVGPMELGVAVRGLNKAAAEVRWTFKELRSFQTHAAKWYNDLKGSWLYGDLPSDLPTLVRTVQGLIDWGDNTVTMATMLRSKRQVFWEKHVTTLFEPRHMVSGMRYRFGSPSTKEEPEGLRDAFKHAQALLAKSKPPTPSVGGSEAQVEDQVMLDLNGAKTIRADRQNMDCDPLVTTSAAPVSFATPSVAPAPVAPVLTVAPVTPAILIVLVGPVTASSAPSSPSGVASTSLPVVSSPLPSSKRKPEDEPEQPLRRASKRISAAAITATTEPDAPRTRAAIKAAKTNAKSAKGKNGRAKYPK